MNRTDFPSFASTYHGVLRQPLRTLVILLWPLGLLSIAPLLAHEAIFALFALGLNSAFGILIIQTYRLYYLAFLPAVTALVTLLFLSLWFNENQPWDLCVLASLYAFFLLWFADQWTPNSRNIRDSSQLILTYTGHTIAMLSTTLAFILLEDPPVYDLLPLFILFSLQLLWFNPHNLRGLFPLMTAINFMIITLIYLSFGEQPHHLDLYGQLRNDPYFLSLMATLALLILSLCPHCRGLTSKHMSWLSHMAFLLALIAYAQTLHLNPPWGLKITTCLLATGALLGYLQRSPNSLRRQLSVCVALILDIFICLQWATPTFIPAMHLALTSAVLFALMAGLNRLPADHPTQTFIPVLSYATEFTLILSHLTVLGKPGDISDLSILTVSLLLLDWLAYAQFKHRIWRVIASILFLYVCHTWTYAIGWNMPFHDRLALIMAQTSLLLLAYLSWVQLSAHPWQPPRSLWILAILATLEWALFVYSQVDRHFSNLLPLLITAIGLSSWALYGILTDRPRQRGYVYWLFSIAVLSYSYVRITLLGWASPGWVDVTTCLISAYTLAALSSWKTYHGTLSIIVTLALLTLFIAPIHSGSYAGTIALLGVSGLCLWLHKTYQQRWLYILGIGLCTASFYFWIPEWFDGEVYLQVYLLPVSVALLVLLQLHQKDLPAATQHKLRLGILALLYTGATIDLFVNQQFMVFLIALGLGLSGIIIGIALRIKAFLYGGVVFLSLNIIGQLFQFYPEQRLAKAIVLMGLGAFITIAMILFNLKRQQILRRMNQLHSSLHDWR